MYSIYEEFKRHCCETLSVKICRNNVYSNLNVILGPHPGRSQISYGLLQYSKTNRIEYNITNIRAFICI